MFEKEIYKRNKQLINFVYKLHDQKKIEPDTYVLDLDSIFQNAVLLKSKADDNNITLFQMTKQFGRNPAVSKAIKKAGITHAVAVDWKEAEILFKNGIKIGNIGHIVQVPQTKINKILKMKPVVWTVYSKETISIIDKEAKKLNIKQDIILRVYNKKTKFYSSQEGGIHVKDIESIINYCKKLNNIKIVGLTAFPCLLLNNKKNKILSTNNCDAIFKAKKIFKKNLLPIEHINMPSANNSKSIPLIKKLGGNFGEPGHAFTGTTPINDNYKNVEIPSILYYSQVSHLFEDKIMTFAGGHYRRSQMKGAFIGEDRVFHKSIPINNESIDYYFIFKKNENQDIYIGDPVISSFRAQIFVTRSKVIVVKGLSSNSPKIIGVYDSQGKKLNE